MGDDGEETAPGVAGFETLPCVTDATLCTISDSAGGPSCRLGSNATDPHPSATPHHHPSSEGTRLPVLWPRHVPPAASLLIDAVSTRGR